MGFNKAHRGHSSRKNYINKASIHRKAHATQHFCKTSRHVLHTIKSSAYYTSQPTSSIDATPQAYTFNDRLTTLMPPTHSTLKHSLHNIITPHHRPRSNLTNNLDYALDAARQTIPHHVITRNIAALQNLIISTTLITSQTETSTDNSVSSQSIISKRLRLLHPEISQTLQPPSVPLTVPTASLSAPLRRLKLKIRRLMPRFTICAPTIPTTPKHTPLPIFNIHARRFTTEIFDPLSDADVPSISFESMQPYIQQEIARRRAAAATMRPLPQANPGLAPSSSNVTGMDVNDEKRFRQILSPSPSLADIGVLDNVESLTRKEQLNLTNIRYNDVCLNPIHIATEFDLKLDAMTLHSRDDLHSQLLQVHLLKEQTKLNRARIQRLQALAVSGNAEAAASLAVAETTPDFSSIKTSDPRTGKPLHLHRLAPLKPLPVSNEASLLTTTKSLYGELLSFDALPELCSDYKVANYNISGYLPVKKTAQEFTSSTTQSLSQKAQNPHNTDYDVMTVLYGQTQADIIIQKGGLDAQVAEMTLARPSTHDVINKQLELLSKGNRYHHHGYSSLAITNNIQSSKQFESSILSVATLVQSRKEITDMLQKHLNFTIHDYKHFGRFHHLNEYFLKSFDPTDIDSYMNKKGDANRNNILMELDEEGDSNKKHNILNILSLLSSYISPHAMKLLTQDQFLSGRLDNITQYVLDHPNLRNLSMIKKLYNIVSRENDYIVPPRMHNLVLIANFITRDDYNTIDALPNLMNFTERDLAANLRREMGEEINSILSIDGQCNKTQKNKDKSSKYQRSITIDVSHYINNINYFNHKNTYSVFSGDGTIENPFKLNGAVDVTKIQELFDDSKDKSYALPMNLPTLDALCSDCIGGGEGGFLHHSHEQYVNKILFYQNEEIMERLDGQKVHREALTVNHLRLLPPSLKHYIHLLTSPMTIGNLSTHVFVNKSEMHEDFQGTAESNIEYITNPQAYGAIQKGMYLGVYLNGNPTELTAQGKSSLDVQEKKHLLSIDLHRCTYDLGYAIQMLSYLFCDVINENDGSFQHAINDISDTYRLSLSSPSTLSTVIHSYHKLNSLPHGSVPGELHESHNQLLINKHLVDHISTLTPSMDQFGLPLFSNPTHTHHAHAQQLQVYNNELIKQGISFNILKFRWLQGVFEALRYQCVQNYYQNDQFHHSPAAIQGKQFRQNKKLVGDQNLLASSTQHQPTGLRKSHTLMKDDAEFDKKNRTLYGRYEDSYKRLDLDEYEDTNDNLHETQVMHITNLDNFKLMNRTLRDQKRKLRDIRNQQRAAGLLGGEESEDGDDNDPVDPMSIDNDDDLDAMIAEAEDDYERTAAAMGVEDLGDMMFALDQYENRQQVEEADHKLILLNIKLFKIQKLKEIRKDPALAKYRQALHNPLITLPTPTIYSLDFIRNIIDFGLYNEMYIFGNDVSNESLDVISNNFAKLGWYDMNLSALLANNHTRYTIYEGSLGYQIDTLRFANNSHRVKLSPPQTLLADLVHDIREKRPEITDNELSEVLDRQKFRVFDPNEAKPEFRKAHVDKLGLNLDYLDERPSDWQEKDENNKRKFHFSAQMFNGYNNDDLSYKQMQTPMIVQHYIRSVRAIIDALMNNSDIELTKFVMSVIDPKTFAEIQVKETEYLSNYKTTQLEEAQRVMNNPWKKINILDVFSQCKDTSSITPSQFNQILSYILAQPRVLEDLNVMIKPSTVFPSQYAQESFFTAQNVNQERYGLRVPMLSEEDSIFLQKLDDMIKRTLTTMGRIDWVQEYSKSRSSIRQAVLTRLHKKLGIFFDTIQQYNGQLTAVGMISGEFDSDNVHNLRGISADSVKRFKTILSLNQKRSTRESSFQSGFTDSTAILDMLFSTSKFGSQIINTMSSRQLATDQGNRHQVMKREMQKYDLISQFNLAKNLNHTGTDMTDIFGADEHMANITMDQEVQHFARKVKQLQTSLSASNATDIVSLEEEQPLYQRLQPQFIISASALSPLRDLSHHQHTGQYNYDNQTTDDTLLAHLTGDKRKNASSQALLISSVFVPTNDLSTPNAILNISHQPSYFQPIGLTAHDMQNPDIAANMGILNHNPTALPSLSAALLSIEYHINCRNYQTGLDILMNTLLRYEQYKDVYDKEFKDKLKDKRKVEGYVSPETPHESIFLNRKHKQFPYPELFTHGFLLCKSLGDWSTAMWLIQYIRKYDYYPSLSQLSQLATMIDTSLSTPPLHTSIQNAPVNTQVIYQLRQDLAKRLWLTTKHSSVYTPNMTIDVTFVLSILKLYHNIDDMMQLLIESAVWPVNFNSKFFLQLQQHLQRLIGESKFLFRLNQFHQRNTVSTATHLAVSNDVAQFTQKVADIKKFIQYLMHKLFHKHSIVFNRYLSPTALSNLQENNIWSALAQVQVDQTFVQAQNTADVSLALQLLTQLVQNKKPITSTHLGYVLGSIANKYKHITPELLLHQQEDELALSSHHTGPIAAKDKRIFITQEQQNDILLAQRIFIQALVEDKLDDHYLWINLLKIHNTFNDTAQVLAITQFLFFLNGVNNNVILPMNYNKQFKPNLWKNDGAFKYFPMTWLTLDQMDSWDSFKKTADGAASNEEELTGAEDQQVAITKMILQSYKTRVKSVNDKNLFNMFSLNWQMTDILGSNYKLGVTDPQTSLSTSARNDATDDALIINKLMGYSLPWTLDDRIRAQSSVDTLQAYVSLYYSKLKHQNITLPIEAFHIKMTRVSGYDMYLPDYSSLLKDEVDADKQQLGKEPSFNVLLQKSKLKLPLKEFTIDDSMQTNTILDQAPYFPLIAQILHKADRLEEESLTSRVIDQHTLNQTQYDQILPIFNINNQSKTPVQKIITNEQIPNNSSYSSSTNDLVVHSKYYTPQSATKYKKVLEELHANNRPLDTIIDSTITHALNHGEINTHPIFSIFSPLHSQILPTSAPLPSIDMLNIALPHLAQISPPHAFAALLWIIQNSQDVKLVENSLTHASPMNGQRGTATAFAQSMTPLAHESKTAVKHVDTFIYHKKASTALDVTVTTPAEPQITPEKSVTHSLKFKKSFQYNKPIEATVVIDDVVETTDIVNDQVVVPPHKYNLISDEHNPEKVINRDIFIQTLDNDFHKYSHPIKTIQKKQQEFLLASKHFEKSIIEKVFNDVDHDETAIQDKKIVLSEVFSDEVNDTHRAAQQALLIPENATQQTPEAEFVFKKNNIPLPEQHRILSLTKINNEFIEWGYSKMDISSAIVSTSRSLFASGYYGWAVSVYNLTPPILITDGQNCQKSVQPFTNVLHTLNQSHNSFVPLTFKTLYLNSVSEPTNTMVLDIQNFDVLHAAVYVRAQLQPLLDNILQQMISHHKHTLEASSLDTDSATVTTVHDIIYALQQQTCIGSYNPYNAPGLCIITGDYTNPDRVIQESIIYHFHKEFNPSTHQHVQKTHPVTKKPLPHAIPILMDMLYQDSTTSSLYNQHLYSNSYLNDVESPNASLKKNTFHLEETYKFLFDSNNTGKLIITPFTLTHLAYNIFNQLYPVSKPSNPRIDPNDLHILDKSESDQHQYLRRMIEMDMAQIVQSQFYSSLHTQTLKSPNSVPSPCWWKGNTGVIPTDESLEQKLLVLKPTPTSPSQQRIIMSNQSIGTHQLVDYQWKPGNLVSWCDVQQAELEKLQLQTKNDLTKFKSLVEDSTHNSDDPIYLKIVELHNSLLQGQLDPKKEKSVMSRIKRLQFELKSKSSVQQQLHDQFPSSQSSQFPSLKPNTPPQPQLQKRSNNDRVIDKNNTSKQHRRGVGLKPAFQTLHNPFEF